MAHPRDQGHGARADRDALRAQREGREVLTAALTVADLYRRFAEVEARGLSPTYEQWALGVADDPELCALIGELPPRKRQVNLVFGSARLHGVPLGSWPNAREWMLRHWAELVPTILDRATQTNEAGRCATHLPVLAEIAGPLALLEVGTSAGLCLYPDRYSYRFRVGDPSTGSGTEYAVDPPTGTSPVVLPCALEGVAPPVRVPDVVWRAGIDLNPLDVADPDDLAWLEALVWPEEQARRDRLAAASTLVRSDPPHIVAGDLLDELQALAAEAPADATLVIFHTAVLVYLAREDRARFVEQVRRIADARTTVWLCEEAPQVFDVIDDRLPPDLDTRGTFVLSLDGVPQALVHPHGRWYRGL